MDLAVIPVRAVLRLASEPVLFARVKLAMAADPAVDQLAIAQANIDLNGQPSRPGCRGDHADTISDVRQAARPLERAAGTGPGSAVRRAGPGDRQWRHQSVPSQRLPYFPRPL
jgi:hypothetical protein